MAETKESDKKEKTNLKPYKDTGFQFHSTITKMDIDTPVLEQHLNKLFKTKKLRKKLFLTLAKSWEVYAASAVLLGLSFLLGLLHGN